MKAQATDGKDHDRIAAGVPFVEAMARRMAASMPHSIDLGDLVQDGMIGLIDAAHRFDERRGIKFETFAERRVRGAMIDALRRDAWPRGVRKVRRELEAAREKLRHELGGRAVAGETRAAHGMRRGGAEPDHRPHQGDRIDVAPRLRRPRARRQPASGHDAAEQPRPDRVCEQGDVARRVRDAIKALPARERKVIGLYYYGDVTMKEIGSEIGVNESRVSQLHARAVQRLRKELGPDLDPRAMAATTAGGRPAGRGRLNMAKAHVSPGRGSGPIAPLPAGRRSNAA